MPANTDLIRTPCGPLPTLYRACTNLIPTVTDLIRTVYGIYSGLIPKLWCPRGRHGPWAPTYYTRENWAAVAKGDQLHSCNDFFIGLFSAQSFLHCFFCRDNRDNPEHGNRQNMKICMNNDFSIVLFSE